MKPRIRPKVGKSAVKTADEFVLTPVSLAAQPSPATRRSEPRKQQSRTAAAPGADLQQPSLPGMARRGRPRLKNPVPATLRAAQSRRKRVEAGTKRIELMLAPDVAKQLDALAEHFKESRAEVVARLLTRVAKRLARQG